MLGAVMCVAALALRADQNGRIVCGLFGSVRTCCWVLACTLAVWNSVCSLILIREDGQITLRRPEEFHELVMVLNSSNYISKDTRAVAIYFTFYNYESLKMAQVPM